MTNFIWPYLLQFFDNSYKGDRSGRLQEIPQIKLCCKMLQLTSRRFLRELDEAPGGNNLQYIY